MTGTRHSKDANNRRCELRHSGFRDSGTGDNQPAAGTKASVMIPRKNFPDDVSSPCIRRTPTTSCSAVDRPFSSHPPNTTAPSSTRIFNYTEYLDTLAEYGLNYTRIYPGAYFETDGYFVKDNPLGHRTGRHILPWRCSTVPGYPLGGNLFDLTPGTNGTLNDSGTSSHRRGAAASSLEYACSTAYIRICGPTCCSTTRTTFRAVAPAMPRTSKR